MGMWILIAGVILIGGGFFLYFILVDGDAPIDDDNVDIHEYENDVPPHPVVEKKKNTFLIMSNQYSNFIIPILILMTISITGVIFYFIELVKPFIGG
ncbi:MAG TPA: hypothetical protein VEP90_28835 [Methylomirabilota bacterium]|nr:hypothetical protein [Methylomirabilota bacterium]